MQDPATVTVWRRLAWLACKQLQNYLAFLFLFMPFFYSFGLSMDVVLDVLIEHSLPWEQRLIMACFYSVRRRQLRCRLRQLQLSLKHMHDGARIVQTNKSAKPTVTLTLWKLKPAQSAFSVNLVHKIVVADCWYDDPWALGLSGTVNPVCVKMVHRKLVVDCLYDDP